MKDIRILILTLFLSNPCYAQKSEIYPSEDSLKSEVLRLHQEVESIQLNLGKADKQFKTGLIISAIGYTVVITGGLMLGRDNDNIGQALLITGGAIGVGGAIVMADAFKFLGRTPGSSGKKNENP